MMTATRKPRPSQLSQFAQHERLLRNIEEARAAHGRDRAALKRAAEVARLDGLLADTWSEAQAFAWVEE